MKRTLSSILFVVALVAVAGLAYLSLSGASMAAIPGAAPVLQDGGDVQAEAAQAPDAPTATNRYNHIALPLDASATIVPFTAQGLLNYIGSGAILIANLNASSQALDFWDGTLGFGVLDGIPIFDPSEYPLEVGHPYLVLLDSSYPSNTPFSIVGDVPDIGTIHFTLAGGTPCKYNEIMVPLDQYDQGISNGVELANAIGNIDLVSELNATSQALDFWDMTLGFGVVDGVPIFDPADFPVRLGYPYYVCAGTAANNDIWP